MKYNYPIKYIVTPIREELCSDEVVVYIATKCYVIGENNKTINLINGDSITEVSYNVFPVFMEKITDSGFSWIRTKPDFDSNFANNNYVTGCFPVNEIFDNFIDAFEVAQLKNMNTWREHVSEKALNDFLSAKPKVMFNYALLLDYYRKLEFQMEKYSRDLILNASSKKQKLIIVKDGNFEVIDMSIYDFIDLYHSASYFAYSVSEDEFDLMESQIKKGEVLDGNLNNTKINPLIMHDSDKSIIPIMNYDDNNVETKGFYLDKEFGETRMYYSELLKTHRFVPSDIDCTRVYTMETFEDIVKSYIPCYFQESDHFELELDGAIISSQFVLKKN